MNLPLQVWLATLRAYGIVEVHVAFRFLWDRAGVAALVVAVDFVPRRRVHPPLAALEAIEATLDPLYDQQPDHLRHAVIDVETGSIERRWP